MKAKFKLLLKLGCVLLISGAIALIVANQNTRADLRAEQSELLNNRDELARLREQNAELEKLRAENLETQKLRLANRDLPRLRNQVTQLRRQAEEAQKLRIENARLSMAGRATADQDANVLPARVTRESLSIMGFGSPRATLETYFAAMMQGNVKRAKECFTADTLARRHIESDDDFLRRPPLDVDGFTGYEIEDRQQSQGEIVLVIRIAPNLNLEPVRFKLVGNEWKISM